MIFNRNSCICYTSSKTVLLIIALFLSAKLTSQHLIEGLYSGMTKSEAEFEIRKNKRLYNQIDFGNNYVFRILAKDLKYSGNKIWRIRLSPKYWRKGMTSEWCEDYLKYSMSYFKSKGYSIFFEPDYWYSFERFENSYGLIMYSSDKSKIVQLFAGSANNIFSKTAAMPFIYLYEYDSWIEAYNKEKRKENALTIQEEKNLYVVEAKWKNNNNPFAALYVINQKSGLGKSRIIHRNKETLCLWEFETQVENDSVTENENAFKYALYINTKPKLIYSSSKNKCKQYDKEILQLQRKGDSIIGFIWKEKTRDNPNDFIYLDDYKLVKSPFRFSYLINLFSWGELTAGWR